MLVYTGAADLRTAPQKWSAQLRYLNTILQHGLRYALPWTDHGQQINMLIPCAFAGQSISLRSVPEWKHQALKLAHQVQETLALLQARVQYRYAVSDRLKTHERNDSHALCLSRQAPNNGKFAHFSPFCF